MSKRLLFWVLFVLWFVLSVYRAWPLAHGYAYFGGDLLLAGLVALLGWGIYGRPVD